MNERAATILGVIVVFIIVAAIASIAENASGAFWTLVAIGVTGWLLYQHNSKKTGSGE